MCLFTDKEVKALDELFQEVGVYRHSKDLKELFDFIKKFPKIAPFNAFLLHIQKPGSQYVASASEWREQFNRTIKPGARPLVILWPFAPELGHLYCGHLGTPNENWWPDRRKEHINIREFEAESVAWLVCERAGIKNPSAEYLSGYLNENAQIPQVSLENVLKAAGMIEAMTLRSLSLRKEVVV